MASSAGRKVRTLSKVYELIEEHGPMPTPTIIAHLNECTVWDRDGRGRKAEWGDVFSGNSLGQSMRSCGLFHVVGETRCDTLLSDANYALWGIKRTPTQMAEEWLSKTHTWRKMNRLPTNVQKEIRRIQAGEQDA